MGNNEMMLLKAKKPNRDEVPLVLKMTCCCLWCCCCLLHCFYCCFPATGAKKHNTEWLPLLPLNHEPSYGNHRWNKGMEPLHGLYAAQSGQELYVQMLNLIYLSAPSYLCILKGRCNHQHFCSACSFNVSFHDHRTHRYKVTKTKYFYAFNKIVNC